MFQTNKSNRETRRLWKESKWLKAHQQLLTRYQENIDGKALIIFPIVFFLFEHWILVSLPKKCSKPISRMFQTNKWNRETRKLWKESTWQKAHEQLLRRYQEHIDGKALIIFPIVFFLFNIGYWSHYLINVPNQ